MIASDLGPYRSEAQIIALIKDLGRDFDSIKNNRALAGDIGQLKPDRASLASTEGASCPRETCRATQSAHVS